MRYWIVYKDRPQKHDEDERLKIQFFRPTACQNNGTHQSKHHLKDTVDHSWNSVVLEAILIIYVD